MSEHSAHLTSLSFGFRNWLWWYTCLLLLISISWMCLQLFNPCVGLCLISSDLNSVWSSTFLCGTAVGTPNPATRSYHVTMIWFTRAIIIDAFIYKVNCSKHEATMVCGSRRFGVGWGVGGGGNGNANWCMLGRAWASHFCVELFVTNHAFWSLTGLFMSNYCHNTASITLNTARGVPVHSVEINPENAEVFVTPVCG